MKRILIASAIVFAFVMSQSAFAQMSDNATKKDETKKEQNDKKDNKMKEDKKMENKDNKTSPAC